MIKSLQILFCNCYLKRVLYTWFNTLVHCIAIVTGVFLIGCSITKAHIISIARHCCGSVISLKQYLHVMIIRHDIYTSWYIHAMIYTRHDIYTSWYIHVMIIRFCLHNTAICFNYTQRFITKIRFYIILSDVFIMSIAGISIKVQRHSTI